MCHSIKNCWEEHLTYMKLMEAHYRASKTKRNSKEVLRYEMDLETNLMNLYRSLKNATYHMGRYREFVIREPKIRLIKALPYPDRIVHQWYIEEFIKPYIIPKFMKDSYACIEGRGTHKAVDTLQKYMRRMQREYGKYYILKCDVKQFFYHIDKNILFKIMSRYIRDKKLLNFTNMLIFDGTGDVGIPIGNYTSQFFANIYMNELDRYLKNTLSVRFVVRYMDDFILLLPTKEEAKDMKQKIEVFLWDHLRLELNSKTNYYPNKMGVNFCGYRIHETHRLLRTNSKRKIKKKIKKWNALYQKNPNMDLSFISQSWSSWLAHASHADTYHLRHEMYKRILFHDYLQKVEE